MEAVEEAGVTVVEVAVALTAEAVVADRTEAALTDANFPQESPLQIGAGFLVFRRHVNATLSRTTLAVHRCLL
jgi:hypothetical protein